MNAIEENDYTRTLQKFAAALPRPKAILCVSAHWMTEGTWVTHQAKPKTIHDFYGFPEPLFQVQYPASGDPKLAEEITKIVRNPKVNLDDEMWGYDHGTWSVLRHLYPKADVPVLQMSLHIEQPAAYHFMTGLALRPLREQGVLIVGSGNIVHNLRRIVWDTNAKPFEWAEKFDSWVKTKLEARAFDSLVHDAMTAEGGALSIPTPDHWYPFLYTLGAAHESEPVSTIYEGLQNGSISMRSVMFGEP